MATVSEVLLQIRNATNCNFVNLKQRAKLLVQEGEITSSGRGLSAAAINSHDCSKLLLVLLLNGRASTIVKKIRNVQKYKFQNFENTDETFINLIKKKIGPKVEDLTVINVISTIIDDMAEESNVFPQILNIGLSRENLDDERNYNQKIYITFKNENESFDIIFSSHTDLQEKEINKSILETWKDITHDHVWNYEKPPILVKSCQIGGGIFEDLAFCVEHSKQSTSKELKYSLIREKKVQESFASELRIQWERDEFILVLDLYLTNPKSIPSKESKEVIEMCQILKRRWYLRKKTNPPKKFRNINGVYMCMCNFRNLDPNIKGGLKPPSYAGVKIWDEFYKNQEKLRKEAKRIKNKINKEFEEKKQEEQFYDEEQMDEVLSNAWVDHNDEDEIDADEDLGWGKKK